MSDMHHAAFRRNPEGHINAPLSMRMAAADVARQKRLLDAEPSHATRAQYIASYKMHRDIVRNNTRIVK